MLSIENLENNIRSKKEYKNYYISHPITFNKCYYFRIYLSSFISIPIDFFLFYKVYLTTLIIV